MNDMFEIKGKVTTAICYAKVIEDEAIEQIRRMCDYNLTRGSKVRIMPDVHAGKGCTIGTTMTITDKICPNIVGVDIGCGMYTVKLQDQVIDFEKIDEACHYIPSGMNVFASPDSDYDVRFVYIRRPEDYLRLDAVRDVIELPIDDVLDINGWDLQKTLRLLYKSNPTLFEWFSSPIVYQKTEFADKFRELMMHYFSSKKTLYHYISMAEGNYREYLQGEIVRAKKYFYVLRPVLACRWILDRGTPPPMLFSELIKEELPIELINPVNQLLELKMNSSEVKLIKRITEINEYLDTSIPSIKSAVRLLDDSHTPDWNELNQLFLRELMK